MVLAVAGLVREGYRFLTKDRDANLSAMSQRIREIETHHEECTKANADLRYTVGGFEQKLLACEEKHSDAESRIESLERKLEGLSNA